ncbi:hypothetical protein ACFFGV_01095 [Pontibacillus salicampi]|uniref:HPr family phosphocarrier protein n=1 Tax=Pontibacillus salicampi TaxID=1449801 RepID=A0ABV6LIF1_9BACI
MKHIMSYDLQLHQRISIKEVMNIYRFIIHSSYEVYFYQNQRMVEGHQLPHLISFFFHYKQDLPILMIINGENVEYAYQKIQSFCDKQIQASKKEAHVTKAEATIPTSASFS